MADLKFKPVPHDHKEFLEKASKRRDFGEAKHMRPLASNTHSPMKCWPLVLAPA
jgi:hypothetical protein